MAGWRIPAASLSELGEHTDEIIIERFMKAMGMKF